MKVGDILYFVACDTAKVSKHKVKSIGINTSNHDFNTVEFSDFKYKNYFQNLHVNPNSSDYSKLRSKFWGMNNSKRYLIFTDAELVQRALIDYVLPEKIETEKQLANYLMEKYMSIIAKVEKFESDIHKHNKEFTKQCNKLKNKIV